MTNYNADRQMYRRQKQKTGQNADPFFEGNYRVLIGLGTQAKHEDTVMRNAN